MKVYVPPNGFIGAGQQTQAAQLVEMGMPRGSNGTRRRKRKSAAKKAPARRKMAKRSKPANRSNGKRLVKGSAAAKRRMAALRKMRRR